jgi:hypothetical protein
MSSSNWFIVSHHYKWSWYLMPLSTIFQLYRCFSFIGKGNQSTWRKPQTCRMSLINFITKCYRFLITGTMLMEMLRERKIIIQKKKLRYKF